MTAQNRAHTVEFKNCIMVEGMILWEVKYPTERESRFVSENNLVLEIGSQEFEKLKGEYHSAHKSL